MTTDMLCTVYLPIACQGTSPSSILYTGILGFVLWYVEKKPKDQIYSWECWWWKWWRRCDDKVDVLGTDYDDDGTDYYDEDNADDDELSIVCYKIINKMHIINFPICSLINLRDMITCKRCRHVIHEHDHHIASCIFLLIF